MSSHFKHLLLLSSSRLAYQSLWSERNAGKGTIRSLLRYWQHSFFKVLAALLKKKAVKKSISS
jgi:hypothetical protein